MEGKVDVVVTDSPVLLGAVYSADCPNMNPHLIPAIIWEHQQLDNLNFFVNRAKPYSSVGRIQDEAGAIVKDTQIRSLLNELGEDYVNIACDEVWIAKAMFHIMGALQK